jgi:hypothetical protein
MPLKDRVFFAVVIFLGFIGILILLASIASASVQADEKAGEGHIDSAEVGLHRRILKLVSLAPVMSEGETVGRVAIYDDPSTQRTEDYMELYNRDGELVAICWFDQFGIFRMTVDYAFIEDLDRFEGRFVTVVNGESI